MAAIRNRLATPGELPFLLLALALLQETAGAQVPVVFRVSEGVRPNAIVSLYGEYLAGAPNRPFSEA